MATLGNQPASTLAVALDGSNVMSGSLQIGAGYGVVFEGTTDNAFETTLTGGDPTADRTIALPNLSTTLGYQNVPLNAAVSGTLTTAMVGQFLAITSGVTIPDATFAAGDVITLYNDTAASVAITCTITTAYIAGVNTDEASIDIATRGLATILFVSGTVCVVSGNVS